MPSIKQIKAIEKNLLRQKEIIEELNSLVRDIERCERTITELQTELEGVNVRHQHRKTTRDDIAYLEDLLKCANKKLVWERQIGSLQKRTPPVLERMGNLLNDPNAIGDGETRAGMLRSLQALQGAMARLQSFSLAGKAAQEATASGTGTAPAPVENPPEEASGKAAEPEA
jgi:chromosome segregation ATPase